MNPRTDTSEDRVPAQQYAALYVAIAWLRGEITSVVYGDDIDKKQLKRLLKTTTPDEIAKVIGKKKGEMDIDYNHYLTERQKHEIGGTRYNAPYKK